MKTPCLGRYALIVSCTALAACSQTTSFSHLEYTPNTSSVGGAATRLSYTVLHSFGAPGDGAEPDADLIYVGDTLYGTTPFGGGHCAASGGCGTVFSITTDGKEHVLYSFAGGTDGSQPNAGFTDVGGKLYGTTAFGGACTSGGCGTVFSITTDGKKKKLLHNFAGGTDGSVPDADMIDVGGKLYGTTLLGGTYCKASGGCGTVFSVTTGGKEKPLHSFGYSTDGQDPAANLVNVGNTLYGTTSSGGAYCAASADCGTVFSIMANGQQENVLHNFGKSHDGSVPAAGLIIVGGVLYGTTRGGGAYCASSGGCGTVFSIMPSGQQENILHSFSGGHDGNSPWARLANYGGTLYGTTRSGGAHGQGTVFFYDLRASREGVAYSFGNGVTDGSEPSASLLNFKGTFYGTTESGGQYGKGTVFAITPSPGSVLRFSTRENRR